MAEPLNPIAWNRYAYVYNSPVNYTDSTGHFIDTLLDAYDLVSNVGSCLGDSDALSCYMVPVNGAALLIPGVTGSGLGDDALRAARGTGKGSDNQTAYLLGGAISDDPNYHIGPNMSLEQIAELSRKYSRVVVNDIQDLRFTELELEGYQLSNVEFLQGNAGALPRLDNTDIFVVAPNKGFHTVLPQVAENILGKNSTMWIASNLELPALELYKTLTKKGFGVSASRFGTQGVRVGPRQVLLDSSYLKYEAPKPNGNILISLIRQF